MKTKLLLIVVIFCLTTRVLATVHMVTVADFSFSPSSFNAHPGDTIMWMWQGGTHTTTSTNIPADAIPWDHNITSASITFMYIPNVLGTYNYYCSVHPTTMTASFTVISPASVAAVSESPGFSVFPNPVSESLYLQISQPDLPVSVTITDITGRQVMAKKYSIASQAEINVAGIPGGTYFLAAMQEGAVYHRQLIVSH